MPRRAITLLALLLCLIATATALILCSGPSRQPRFSDQVSSGVALSGPTMGSTWMVRLRRLPDGTSSGQVQSAVQSVLDGIEQRMSTYRNDSDLSRFNQSRSTDWFPVHEDVASVVNTARGVSEQTAGAFDVTVGPLVNLWGFGPDHPAGPFGTVPSDQMIQTARQHVGYRLLEARLAPAALRKSDPLVYVDLSGIAKGFAAEAVGRRLASMGIAEYLVGIGGEMRGHTAGRPWRIGIETPTPGVRRVLYQVELGNFSLSTSGDYRNFFDQDGHRYCHEIDPSTGRPVLDPPASVSVVHPSGACADAMATALMVLGREKGFAFAEQHDLVTFFIVRQSHNFQAKATSRFRPLLASGAKTCDVNNNDDTHDGEADAVPPRPSGLGC